MAGAGKGAAGQKNAVCLADKVDQDEEEVA